MGSSRKERSRKEIKEGQENTPGGFVAQVTGFPRDIVAGKNHHPKEKSRAKHKETTRGSKAPSPKFNAGGSLKKFVTNIRNNNSQKGEGESRGSYGLGRETVHGDSHFEKGART